MDETEIGTHESHCCVLHGCKYGNDNCPVVKRTHKQDYMCEWCETEGLKKIPDPKDPDYPVLEMSFLDLRKELIKARKELRKLKGERTRSQAKKTSR